MMIAQMNHEEGKQFILLGLSEMNIRRLVAGEPIKITRESHGDVVPENLIIGIMYGKSEKMMRDVLAKMGLITPDTKETSDPRL